MKMGLPKFSKTKATLWSLRRASNCSPGLFVIACLLTHGCVPSLIFLQAEYDIASLTKLSQGEHGAAHLGATLLRSVYGRFIFFFILKYLWYFVAALCVWQIYLTPWC